MNTVAKGSNLRHGYLGSGAGNPYYVGGRCDRAYRKGVYQLPGIELGVNALMPELAQLLAEKRASILANTGTLVEPLTREQLHAGASRPVFLFAHNHQRRILHTGQANSLEDLGWAGRIADTWQGINGNSPLGMNVSYGGSNRLLTGKSTAGLSLADYGDPLRHGFMVAGRYGDDERAALFKALSGRDSSASKVSFAAITPRNDMQRLYGNKLNKSYETFNELYRVWKANPISYSRKNAYGGDLFSLPSSATLGLDANLNGSLLRQVERVAKMIQLAAEGRFSHGKFSRQIFYLNFKGFDTHSDQALKHPLLLRELSLALWSFQQALEEKGLAHKVMTFTMSDFGRSLTKNGSGTDHAWAGHQLVLGGDGSVGAGKFHGGDLIGRLPDLTLGGVDDHADSGRLIPSQCQDQLSATLCSWLGVSDAQIVELFPNLHRFETDPGVIRSAYINQLFG